MQQRLRGNEYRTTIVCVDSYTDDVPTGRFYNPGHPGGEFKSLTQFLLRMEDMLDGMKLPQSFTAVRSFSDPPAAGPPGAPQDESPQEGELATFAVRVLFRQNASWQGSVTWLDTGREESFRSVLELILLMDSALREGRPM